MLGRLFKPKWQSDNARTRIQALPDLGSDSPELIQLAQNDPNTGVRLEAITYLTDFPTLIQLGKRTDSVGERARNRLLGLSATQHQQDALLLDVFDWLQTNPALMESIARDAERDLALRKLALPEVSDENLLFDIASQDSSREIQYLAASRLNDLDKLKKLEKSQGRNNKRLRQLLKDRMAQEQALQQRHNELETLCTKLEALGQSGHWAQDKTQFKVICQSWKQRAKQGAIPAELEKRFHDAEKEFTGRLEQHEQHEAALQPLRAEFLACLEQAEKLNQDLQEQPENWTISGIEAQLLKLQTHWVEAQELPDSQQQAALNQQWAKAYAALSDTRDKLAVDLEALEHLQTCCAQAEKLREQTQELQGKRLTDLQSAWVTARRPQRMSGSVAALEQRFHRLMSSLNARLQREAGERSEKLARIYADLDQMDTDLENEKYGEAVDLHRAVSEQLKQMQLAAKDKTKIEQRLRAAAPMVMEFKDWRRWGTDQAREHLIETAQRLENDVSLDPEQRAREIKALREEWRRLAKMDPGRQRKQWKDFDSKVTAAYEPSKQHFAEQAKKRAEHLKQREAVCTQLETMSRETDWENPELDWKAQYEAVNELRKAWKKCGTVGHKEWKAVNQRFNAAMDVLDEHLKPEREANFRARQRLQEQAQALTEIEDTQAAVAEAKALQARWHITVPSRSREEQKLWKQFRAPLDEVFRRLKSERDAQRLETDQHIRQKEMACQQLEDWLALEGEAFLSTALPGLEECRNQFNTAGEVPKAVQRKLDSRFQAAEEALLQRQEQIRWQQRLDELDELAQASQERKSAEEPEQVQEANQAAGERLCLQLEILLDIPTPDDFQQARMEYQVAQMSEAMRSRRGTGNENEQALMLLREWYQLGAMPAAAVTAQQARIGAMRQAMSK